MINDDNDQIARDAVDNNNLEHIEEVDDHDDPDDHGDHAEDNDDMSMMMTMMMMMMMIMMMSSLTKGHPAQQVWPLHQGAKSRAHTHIHTRLLLTYLETLTQQGLADEDDDQNNQNISEPSNLQWEVS